VLEIPWWSVVLLGLAGTELLHGEGELPKAPDDVADSGAVRLEIHEGRAEEDSAGGRRRARWIHMDTSPE
jgi:hypothetical protein